MSERRFYSASHNKFLSLGNNSIIHLAHDIYFVCFDPSRMPVRILPKEVNLIRIIKIFFILFLITLSVVVNLRVNGPVCCGISNNVRIHCSVDSHDNNDDVKGVDKPVVNHLQIGSLWNHLIDRRLYCGHNHHGGDGYHDTILEVGNLEVEGEVGNPKKEDGLDEDRD